MGRSLFKLPFVHRSLFGRSIARREKIFKNNSALKVKFDKLLSEKKSNLYLHFCFWKRASCLNKYLSTRKIMIHSGKFFIIKTPNLNSKGFKLGEFSVTRKRPKHKGKKRQSKKVRPKTIKYIR